MSYHVTHRSPGLTAIFNAVKKSNKNQILDLGPSKAQNFNFFAQLGCRFHFENMDDGIEALHGDENSVDEYLETFLKYINKDQRFDIVLVWDLFNFVPQNIVGRLYEKLEDFLKPNTILFMLNYVGANRPKYPSDFRISDQYHIEMNTNGEIVENIEKATTAKTLKSLPKYFMLRSYLNHKGMSSGISEQILCFNPEKSAKTSTFSNAEVSNDESAIELKFKSPAISLLRSDLEKHQRHSVLDLGGKNGNNEEHWKRQYQEVYALDLRLIMKRIAAMSADEQKEYLQNGQFLSFDAEQVFDVIMVWDLLNFVSDEVLFEFGRRLSRHARDGSLLIAQCYTGDKVPAAPRPFVLTQSGMGLAKRMAVRVKERAAPHYSSLKLQKAFPGFYSLKSFAVQPGMLKGICEYVLVFKDAETLGTEKKAMFEEVQARRLARGLAS